MSESETPGLPRDEILRLTTEVVSSFVGKNATAVGQIADVITTVFNTLDGLRRLGGDEPVEARRPSVSIRRSITPDYIICLEDGKKLKMLKRHLRTTYGMTPEEYRTKWNLAPDYPMVAPNYARQRSEFAKQIGLGRSDNGRDKGR